MDTLIGERDGRKVYERPDGSRYVVLPDGRYLENGDADRPFTPEPAAAKTEAAAEPASATTEAAAQPAPATSEASAEQPKA